MSFSVREHVQESNWHVQVLFEQKITTKYSLEKSGYGWEMIRETVYMYVHFIFCFIQLFQTEFTSERLRVSVQRLLADVPSHKRNGMKMAACVLNQTYLNNPTSNGYNAIHVRQAAHLASVLEELNTNPTIVVQKMNELRSALWQPTNLHVQVVGDASQLGDVFTSLHSLIPDASGNAKDTLQVSYLNIIERNR